MDEKAVGPVLMVSGPTACGKSELGIRLAKALKGEIISVDSVQVYRGFNVGSAKASTAEQSAVPHHLIDTLEPDQRFNAGEFVRRASEAIADVRTRERVPILVGGTTMYITSLLKGLSELPTADEKIREELQLFDNAELHQRLKKIDPESAVRINQNDRHRIIRALETYLVDGKTLSHYHSKPVIPSFDALIIVPLWERELLYQRIDERSANMVEKGLEEEVKAIVKRYGKKVEGLKSLGYTEALKVLDGKLSASKLSEEIALNTRRFAKRQMTYWRNEPLKRGWRCRPDASEAAIELAAESKIKRSKAKGFRVLEIDFDELNKEIVARLAQPFDSSEVWYVSASNLSVLK